MKNLSRRLPALTFVACLLAYVLPAGALDVEVAHYELKNGMDVVVIPDRRAPVVTHMVWYRVGSADEPSGKAGIAHFFEHLMFKGTEKLPGGEFSQTVKKNGGQDNAFTSKDFTAYFQRIASDRLDMVMSMEADRMLNLTLTNDDVLPERDVVKEERRSNIDNQIGSLLAEQMDAMLYSVHPYRKPVIGWKSSIPRILRN